MKHLKTLVLAALAATLLMIATAGSASATVLCSVAQNPCPAGSVWPATSMDWSLKSGTTARFTNTGNEPLDSCSGSTLKGTLFNGSSTATASASVNTSELTWSSCSFPTTTISGGSLQIHNQTGTTNGTVTGSEFAVTMNTLLFGSCVYTVSEGTDIGTITAGSSATLTVNALVKRGSGSNVVCPETGKWTGEYKLTAPITSLLVEPS